MIFFYLQFLIVTDFSTLEPCEFDEESDEENCNDLHFQSQRQSRIIGWREFPNRQGRNQSRSTSSPRRRRRSPASYEQREYDTEQSGIPKSR
jgi:hypothetical protein